MPRWNTWYKAPVCVLATNHRDLQGSSPARVARVAALQGGAKARQATGLFCSNVTAMESVAGSKEQQVARSQEDRAHWAESGYDRLQQLPVMKSLEENTLPLTCYSWMKQILSGCIWQNNSCTLFLVDRVLYTFRGGLGSKGRYFLIGLVWSVRDASPECGRQVLPYWLSQSSPWGVKITSSGQEPDQE